MTAISLGLEGTLGTNGGVAPREVRATPYAWYLAGLLAVAHLVSFVDRYVMSLLIEPIRMSFGLSDTQLGMLTGGAFALLYAAAALPLGRLADIRSRRMLIACGLTVWSMATAACALADSFGGLFGARLLVGVGEAALVPAAMSLLGAYFARDQMGRAISMFTMGAALGKATALIGGAMLLAALTPAGLVLLGYALLPWQAVFLAAATLGLILVPFMLTIVEPARHSNVGAPTLADALRHMRRHLRAFVPHIIAACSTILLVQAFGAWSPAYFARERGFSIVDAGFAVGMVSLAAQPIGNLFGGWATDRLTRKGAKGPAITVILCGMTCAVPCALLLVTLPDGALPLFALGALLFSVSTTAGPCLAGLQALTPAEHRGAVTSVYMCSMTLVAVGLGPVIVGMASDYFGSGKGGLGVALGFVTVVVATIGISAALIGRGAVARVVATLDRG